MSGHNLAPYLAAAVAHNPRAMQRLEKFVGTQRGHMLVLAKNGGYADHRAITMGRAEHAISARLFLGFLETLSDENPKDEQKLFQIFRNGWPRAISEAEMKENPSIAFVARSSAERNADDLSIMFELVVFQTACSLLGKRLIAPETEKDDTEVFNNFIGWVRAFEAAADKQGAPYMLDGKRYPEKRREYFSSGMIDHLNAVRLSEESSRAFDIAQTIAGIDTEAYTDGITLSSQELEAISAFAKSAEEANSAAYMTMLLKAANADKKFAFTQSNDEPTARYRAAEQQLRELGVQFDVAKQRIDIIQEQLLAEQERSKRREAEQAEQAADLAELAALRNALYQMDADDDDPGDDAAIQWEKPRELPPHLVSLGGLPPWRAEMAKRIPDAKFIPADVTLPEDTIRTASELWIEPSYLGHSAFYRAVAVAKAAGVPVKYWPGRNVDLCMRAVQTAK